MAEINRKKSEGKMVNIGFENRVFSNRIIAIINPNSAPIKRSISEAKANNLLIEATGGKPKRSAIITDSNHIILSSISSRHLSKRIEGKISD